MLKAPTLKDPLRTDGRFAIVCSRYNAEYTDPMLDAARTVLEAAGASFVEVIRVPGAFEIPMAASAVARRKRSRVRAILCLESSGRVKPPTPNKSAVLSPEP